MPPASSEPGQPAQHRPRPGPLPRALRARRVTHRVLPARSYPSDSVSVYTDGIRAVKATPGAPQTHTTSLGDAGQGGAMPAHDDGRSAEQAKAAIQAALGQIGFCLPGSIVIRRTRCGKPRCACKADPPSLHGPYIQWTRTVGGKTVTRKLTQAQYDTYAGWFASARRLRALAAELEALSLEEMARAEGWATITPGTPAPPRTRPARGPNPPKTPKPKLRVVW